MLSASVLAWRRAPHRSLWRPSIPDTATFSSIAAKSVAACRAWSTGPADRLLQGFYNWPLGTRAAAREPSTGGLQYEKPGILAAARILRRYDAGPAPRHCSRTIASHPRA